MLFHDKNRFANLIQGGITMKNHTRINKLLTVLLLLCVSFVCMAGTAMAAEDCAHVFADGQCTTCGIIGGYCGAEGDGTNLVWTLNDGTFAITGTGAMADYTSSTRPWADYYDSVTNLVIEDGVTAIGNAAFYECKYLTSVEMPDSVTSIGKSAFSKCAGLTSLDLPDNVTFIGSEAFYGCTGLTSLTIPASVTEMYNAFFGCSGLTDITISDGVTSIHGAFYRCTGLTSITIPNSVTSISSAFYGCTGLESIVVPDSVTEMDYAFYGCTGLRSANIPSSVTSINGAFRGCTSLTSIEIPDSVTTIGVYAFTSCTGLTSIVIPDSVTSIGKSAFSRCTGLKSVVIPDSVTTIGDYAFSGCTGLESVAIPNSVTYFSVNVFEGCTQVSTVIISCTPNNAVYYCIDKNFRRAERIYVHAYENGVCTDCGEPCPGHTGGEATCTEKAVCTICGASYGEVGGHTPDENGYTVSDGTHSYSCAVCGVTVTEPHTYDDEDGTCVCSAVKTYTVSFNPYGDSGVKIVEINGEAKEILHGETFTVPHGQELTVKFANTVSQMETGVYCDGYVVIDPDLIMCNYNEATNTLIISGSQVTGDIDIFAAAYVRVQFNLHGGTLSEYGEGELEESFGFTWVADTSTLKATYGFSSNKLPDYFQLAGHTLAGVKVNGSDEVVQLLSIRSDMTVDILWQCDGTAILTPVPAKDATCTEAGNIAHYTCTCGKLYAEDETTVLTADEVKTDVDPSNHVGMDPATGMCVCGEFVAVAQVDDAYFTDFGTAITAWQVPEAVKLTLHANVETSARVVFTSDHGDTKVLDLNGCTWTNNAAQVLFYGNSSGMLTIQDSTNAGGAIVCGKSGTSVIFNDGTLNITGGTIAATDDYTNVIDNGGTAYISGNAVLKSTCQQASCISNSTLASNAVLTITGDAKIEAGNVAIGLSGTVDLSGAKCAGWVVKQNNSGSLLRLPDNHVLQMGDKLVTTLANGETGTIVEHKTHDYATPKFDNTHHWDECACGATTEKVEHTFTYTPVTGKEVHIVGCSGCTYTAAEPHTFTQNDAGEWVCDCKAKAVASITSGSTVTKYMDFADALAAWTDGTTLTLLDNVTYDASIEPGAGTRTFVGGKHTLDLAGKCLLNEGTLTIQNAKITSNAAGVIVVDNQGMMMIKKSTITNSEGTAIGNLASLTVENSVLNAWSACLSTDGDTAALTNCTLNCQEIEIEYAKGKLTIAGDCDGWEVRNTRDVLVAIGTYIELPEGYYMFELTEPGAPERLVTSLNRYGTIRAHEHEYTYTDNGDGTHSYGCTCGLATAARHDFAENDAGEWVCACKAKAVAMVEAGGTATCYTALETALGAAQSGSKVTLLASVELTSEVTIPSYVTFNGGEFTFSGEKLLNNGTITGGTFTATVTNWTGDITGGTFDTISYFLGAVSGQISFKTLDINSYSPEIDLSQAVDIVGARIGIITNDLPVSELKLPDGCALEVAGKIVSTLLSAQTGIIVAHEHGYTYTDQGDGTHSGACPCGAITAAEPHTFAQNDAGEWVCDCKAKAVAKVGDTFYVSIHNALRAAEKIDGCTLTLLEDITLTSMSSTAAYTNTGTFTLDLNGKTLSSNKGTLSVLGSAELTIKDSAGGGKIISTGSNAIYQTGGTVTIESGTFEGTLDGVFLSGASTLSVKGGSFVGSRAMITGFGSDCVIDLTAIDPAGFTLKNNGSGTFAPRLPNGYAMVNGSGTVVESLSAEESATVKDSLENATVTLSENNFAYDGQPHMPTVTVTLDGTNLTEGTDYQVLYMVAKTTTNGKPTHWFGDHTTSVTCVKADDGYYAVIIGMGNYYTADEFTLYKNFVIEPRLLTIKADDQTIPVGGSVDSANFTITEGALVEGHTLTAEVQVADGTLATPGTYTNVLYLDTDSVSIMAGEENVKSNYSITLDTGTLTIVEHIHEWTYTASDDTITATCVSTIGACPHGTITFKLVIPTGVDFNSGADEKTATWTMEPASADGLLSCGTTYSAVSDNAKLADGKPCNAGEYEVTLNVENAATVTATLTIDPVQIGQPDALTDGVYTGEVHQPAVTIPNCTEGKDFTVTYPEDMVNAGDKTITVTGMGNYTGSVELAYEINRAPIGAAVIAAEAQVYTGEALEPAFTVTLNGKTLGDSDYVFEWTNNVNVGEGKIVISGIGNYEGQAEGTFAIAMADAALSVQTDKDFYTYGETVTVTASRAAKPATFALRSAIAPDQMALFLGDTQIGEAVDAVDGTYTMTVNTADKELSIGENTLRVVYVSDGNLKDAEAPVTVLLLPKELTIINAGADDRVYEKGNKLVDVTGVDLDGIVGIGDDVKADLTDVQGTLPSDNAGTYTTMALPRLILTGSDSVYYTIAADDEVTTSVEITPKEITNPTIVLDASSFVYDGTEKKPAVTAVKDGDDLIDAAEYTVSYTNNIEMGTATVTLTDVAGGNYTVSGSTTFHITQSGTEMTATADKNSYTYGETITVTGTVKATGTAPAATLTLRSAPAAQQVALFAADGTQLTDPVYVVDGAYTLTYNTADKDILPAASITLTVKFVGDDNMADQSAAVTVALTAKSIEPVLSGSASKVYDGTATVTDAGNLMISLNGVIAGDNVSAAAAGYAYADEIVGQSKNVTAKGITLSGADSTFYTLAQTEASAQIGEIKKAMLIGLTEPADTTLDVYCADADAVIGKLPDTVVYHLADGKTVDLKVEWSYTAYDSTPGATNTFAWAVSDSEKLAFYEIAQNVADDGTIIVTNSAFLPVTVTGTDTAITYNGTTYDVTQMFAIDSNAGAAVFEIIGGGTGEGTLNGSVLTITKAGTINIKVTTAPNAAYAAGEATAVLTISKGTPAVTLPTDLTAWYGQKLSDIALPTVDGGAWSWTDMNSTVGNSGVQTHQAIFTPADTNLWNITTHPVNITVAQAGTSFGEMKVYNGDTETTTFTYGETITVKATATAVQPAVFSLRSLIAPAKHQMALFIRNADGSEVQISEAVNEQNGVYTMTYNTAGKALSIGDNALIAKFVGDENMADYQETVLVTLNPKELTIASLTAQDRVYEPGNQQVALTGTEVSGKADANDDVSVLTDGMTATINSENVGTYDTALISQDVSLTGNHAGYYFARGNVSVGIPKGVEITQATPYTASGAPAQPVFDPIYQDGQILGDIPVSLPAGTFNVPGTIEWKASGDTSVTEGTPFTWVFTPDDPNWKPVSGTVVIYPDGEPPVITAPAGDQEVTVFEGEQGTMFITAADASSYQWYINRYDGLGYVPISGATSASYTTSVVNLGNDGFTYYCVASNAYGDTESPVFLLQVLEKIEVPETGDESNIALWTALMFLSIAGLTIITMNGRRRKITR